MLLRLTRWSLLLLLIYSSLALTGFAATAASTPLTQAPPPGEPITLMGEITHLTDNSLTLGDQQILITADTVITGNLAVGRLVFVLAEPQANNHLVALHIDVLHNDDPQVMTITGIVEALTNESITVDGHTAHITDQTTVSGVITVGAFVYLEAVRAPNGPWHARHIEVVDGGGYFEHIGPIELLTDHEIIVAGLPFVITNQTVIEGPLAVGDLVFIEAEIDANGTFIALYIERLPDNQPHEIRVTGILSALTNTHVTVADVTAALTADTHIDPNLAVGDWAHLLARVDDDGHIIALIVDPAPDGDIMHHMGPIEVIEAHTIIVAGLEFTITADTEIIGDPIIGDWAFVIARHTANGLLEALRLEVTPHDNPGETITLIGVVEALTDHSLTVDGFTAEITDRTEILGTPAVGDRVLLVATHGPNQPGGEALFIEVLTDDQPPQTITVRGPISALTNNSITVADVTATITADTTIHGQIAVGHLVQLTAVVTPDGQTIAHLIERIDGGHFTHIGHIEELTDNSIIVAGLPFHITPNTHIIGNLALNSFVYVEARETNTGFLALYIEVLDHDGPNQPVITFVGPITALSDNSLTIEGHTIHIGPDTDIEGTLALGQLAHVIARETDNGGLLALLIQILDDGQSGTVEALTTTSLTVAGQTYSLDANTAVIGTLMLGESVYVGATLTDGTLTAYYVEAFAGSNVLYLPFIQR